MKVAAAKEDTPSRAWCLQLPGTVDQKFWNVVYLGICFLTSSAASSTITNLQKVILAGIHDDNPEYDGDGYIGLAISCSFTAVSLWLAPSFLTLTGSKNALIIGAVGELIFSGSFYLESTLIFYVVSAISGVTHALLWTGQGVYLIENSTPKTVVRDSSIFWFLYHISPVLGNVSAFCTLAGKSSVDAGTRVMILDVMNVILALSVVMFCFLPASSPRRKNPDQAAAVTDPASEPKPEDCAEALRQAWLVFTDTHMLALMILFVYSGLQIAYSETIYNSSVGFTLSLSQNVKELVPLTGIFNGIGILLGVCIQTLQQAKAFNWTNSVYLTIGIQFQLICYVLTGLNLPNESAFGDTQKTGVLFNSVPLALLSSVLLGIGNMSIQTYVSSLIATLFWERSSQVSAIFNFSEFVWSAVCFIYSTRIGLYAQLVILIITAILGNIVYILVETRVRKRRDAASRKTAVNCDVENNNRNNELVRKLKDSYVSAEIMTFRMLPEE
nr:PREDICTED: UNC93-like protein MFSD11 isoform X1 [Bemisia tabaci]XP_018917051.1 PREDICTED: UNC93-like protein MFSD11 isoform X1 [Bemisia tabaci]